MCLCVTVFFVSLVDQAHRLCVPAEQKRGAPFPGGQIHDTTYDTPGRGHKKYRLRSPSPTCPNCFPGAWEIIRLPGSNEDMVDLLGTTVGQLPYERSLNLSPGRSEDRLHHSMSPSLPTQAPRGTPWQRGWQRGINRNDLLGVRHRTRESLCDFTQRFARVLLL
jgi:hypothetical protein